MITDDEPNGTPLPRLLSESGTESERRLLTASRGGNAADEAIRQRVFARLLAGETPRRVARARRAQLRVGLAAFGFLATTVAATVTLKLTSKGVAEGEAERPLLSAEAPEVRGVPSPRAANRPSALTPCAKVVGAPGLDARIDDLEDGNANLLPIELRQGTWYIATDGTGTLSEPPVSRTPATLDVPEYFAGPWHPKRLARARGQSRYALHTRGGKFTAWGVVASAQFVLEPGACYDASAYAGLEFWAKGTSRIAVSARMSDVTPVSNGGLCERDCFKRHQRQIELSPEWQHHTVAWSEFVQYVTPSTLAFDPKRLWGIDFVVAAGSTPFELWIDDVNFLPRTEATTRPPNEH